MLDMTATERSPISLSYEIPCSPERAFALYTGRIGEWWDPRYSRNAESLQSVTIESRPGGRVFATHSDSGEDDWGEVIEWVPGHRLTHSFSLAQDPAHPSTVSVRFEPAEGGSTMHFEHGGWTEQNADARSKFGDWPALLGRFVDLAKAPAA